MTNIILRVAGKHQAAEAMSAKAFMDSVSSQYKGGRVLRVNGGPLRGTDSVFVNFFNLPGDVLKPGQGGAEAENNRMMFIISGFDPKDANAPSPSGKVKIELSISALPRDYKLRAKTGTPEAIAKYLVDFLTKVTKEVEPKFTHTKR